MLLKIARYPIRQALDRQMFSAPQGPALVTDRKERSE